ncbi:MAG: helix-turn-helix domain-containing protein [Lysobacter sp.]
MTQLGARIAQHRLRQDTTQRALAEASGVPLSTLRRIERTGLGSMEDYVAIMQALGLVDALDQFLPEPLPSPKLLHAAQGRVRKRASRATKD